MSQKGLEFEKKILYSLNRIDKNKSSFIKFETPKGINYNSGTGYYKSIALNDFIGCYNGKFVLIEAKVTRNKLPYSRLKDSQWRTLKKFSDAGGISIIIIFFEEKNVVGAITYKNALKHFKKHTSIKYDSNHIDIIKNASLFSLDIEALLKDYIISYEIQL